jgi:hypothetical protein
LAWAEEDHELAALASLVRGASEAPGEGGTQAGKVAHEPVRGAVGAGGDGRSAWLRESGFGVGGHGCG